MRKVDEAVVSEMYFFPPLSHLGHECSPSNAPIKTTILMTLGNFLSLHVSGDERRCAISPPSRAPDTSKACTCSEERLAMFEEEEGKDTASSKPLLDSGTSVQVWPTKHAVTSNQYATSTDSRGFIPGWWLGSCWMRLCSGSQDFDSLFPVYEYTLNNHTLMMDSDNGMILFTAIWKSLGYGKTDVVGLIQSHPSISSLIRKVRGGYLKIQGTWLTFELAKELSKRIAWEIRHDLVPFFGPSFPSQCIAPGQPGFGQLLIPSPYVEGRKKTKDPEVRAAAQVASKATLNNSQVIASEQVAASDLIVAKLREELDRACLSPSLNAPTRDGPYSTARSPPPKYAKFFEPTMHPRKRKSRVSSCTEGRSKYLERHVPYTLRRPESKTSLQTPSEEVPNEKKQQPHRSEQVPPKFCDIAPPPDREEQHYADTIRRSFSESCIRGNFPSTSTPLAPPSLTRTSSQPTITASQSTRSTIFTVLSPTPTNSYAYSQHSSPLSVSSASPASQHQTLKSSTTTTMAREQPRPVSPPHNRSFQLLGSPTPQTTATGPNQVVERRGRTYQYEAPFGRVRIALLDVASRRV